ncbi:hypothetical protein ScPMuIL_001412 [Solemya velum]
MLRLLAVEYFIAGDNIDIECIVILLRCYSPYEHIHELVCGSLDLKQIEHVSGRRISRRDDHVRTFLDTAIDGLTGKLSFNSEGTLQRSNFKIQNLHMIDRRKIWKDIGYIRGDDVHPFGIIWPGEMVSSHIVDGVKMYRIVTNPVKPFVFEQPPHRDYGSCAQDTTCLKVFTKDKLKTIQLIRDYEQGKLNKSNPYEIRCCRGLSIDLLNRLAADMDFRYTLYIVHDETYGQIIDGEWNGMVRDLIDGTAHLAVAAFSITRSRAQAIDFTNPYFFSGFSVLYTETKRATHMHAFLEPFSIEVWFAIFISGTLTAIAMGLFEWNSPFGLNPWGRKRKANYSLASGLTMVYSVLFGHTVRTKSPKSWPGKVMQNFWAFAAIFIIASYTANLAAYIAGKHAGINYSSIYDPRMLDIRIGVLEGSAVQAFLKKVNTRLLVASRKYHVPSSDVAIKMLIKDNELDAYLGDYPILDYARAKLDPSCDLRLLSQSFGEDGYGIGLPRGSPLKTPLSKKIQEYHESGYIEDLIDVHFADAQCYKQRITQEESQLEVQHHAGLFVMFTVGIIVGILILCLEHVCFKYLVPYARARPGNSVWKSTHCMFVSQRLHRIITSAELVSAQDAAREMLGIMRNREFARLFQKSTIRKNKLADMAKMKRLNRNFLDVVEKAKWMKQMKDNNLFGDDSPDAETPCITEISLKDLCQQIDLEALRRPRRSDEGLDDASKLIDEWPDNWQDDWLLPESPVHVPGPSALSDDLDTSLDNVNSENALLPSLRIESEVTLEKQSEIQCDTVIESVCRPPPPQYSELRFVEKLPNGHLSCGDIASLSHDRFIRSNLDNNIKPRTQSWDDDTYGHSDCQIEGPFVLPSRQGPLCSAAKTQRSLSDGHSPPMLPNVNMHLVDDVSKEDLLLMWKKSEIEMSQKLDQALLEKSRLEKKLAQLDMHVHSSV